MIKFNQIQSKIKEFVAVWVVTVGMMSYCSIGHPLQCDKLQFYYGGQSRYGCGQSSYFSLNDGGVCKNATILVQSPGYLYKGKAALWNETANLWRKDLWRKDLWRKDLC